jgi:aspartate aminotransferase
MAVDAKAKALARPGESVIGFAAGEPDFPTPPTSSRPRSGRRPTPRCTATRRPPASPELREAIAERARATGST